MKKIIIISIISVLFIGLLITSIIFGVNLDKSLKENKTLRTDKINLTVKISKLEKELTDQKEITANIQKDLDISNGAGLLVTSVLTEIENLYYRYDNIFVKTYNYCNNNVEWNYTGLVDMNYFLKEQQKIQSDYETLLNRVNTLND
jgi:hypothetical protein